MDTLSAPLKQCRACKQFKPATPEYFNKTSLSVSPDGLNKQCKVCRNAYRRTYQKKERPPEGYKRCTGCAQVFPATLDFFFGNHTSKDGVGYRCKPCQVEYQRSLYRGKKITPATKICPRCQQEKPASAFSPVKNARDGLYPVCKLCKNAQGRVSYIPKLRPTLPEGYKRCSVCQELKPADKACFSPDKNHRDGLSSACRQCRTIQIARLRQLVDQNRQLPAKGQMKGCASCGVLRPATLEFFSSDASERDGLAGKCKQCVKKYYQMNRKAKREAFIAYGHNRRAREEQAEGFHTAEDIRQQYQRQKGRCYWCQKPLGKKYEVDHIIPLSRGGTNWPDNLVLTCVHCNRSKHDRLPHEWPEGSRLL